MSIRTTLVEINLNNLTHNCRQMQSLQPKGLFFCPMVKADAYGHGAERVVTTLMDLGVDNFGLALYEEAQELRELGIVAPHLLVFAPFSLEALKLSQQLSLTPVLATLSDFKILSSFEFTKPQPVHLMINTGMNRLGLDMEHIESAISEIKSNQNIQLKGVCTHLNLAEDMGHSESFSALQLKKFESIKKAFKGLTDNFHVFNSAGLIGKNVHSGFDIFNNIGSRPGISLYGAMSELSNSMSQEKLKLLGLKPVMGLKTKIIHTHRLQEGESLSYGCTWRAQKPTTIGVLPIGYADGLSRALSNRGEVLVSGRKCLIIGTICMDFCMVDITVLTKAQQGDWVYVIGRGPEEGPSAASIAEKLNTISYEILTGVGKRVPRVYKGHI